MEPDLLLVEDDADLADNLAEIVAALGYRPCLVASAEQALEQLSRRTFIGVLTDLRLPGLDGVELIRRLREAKLPTPIVLLTAFADQRVISGAEEAGALAVLHKPVNLERLFALLAEFSRQRSQVLIVDDNEALAENMAEALVAAGLRVLVEHSALAALAQRALPRVALVDLRLPDQSGLEVARRLSARDPSLTILFITAFEAEFANHCEQIHARLPGAVLAPTILMKPFQLDKLVQKIHTLLANPA